MERGLCLLLVVLCSIFDGGAAAVEHLNQNHFPDKFLFGVATASYQIEGAWNLNGKGVNIWDRFTHDFPHKILDRSTGDVACDSYHKYKEDVQLIKALGADFYRFSLSWSRILPTGYVNSINEDGIAYYNNLINELIANGITPMVTLFHWDLPQPLHEIGGWPNPALADYFVDFAKVAFSKFGDRVKHWITINEPKQICKLGYGEGILAPGYTSAGVADYLCTYTLLKAHAGAYHAYDEIFRINQKGVIGITAHSFWYEPGSKSGEDWDAANRLFEFYFGIFFNPIFGTGDFPRVVRQYVDERSRKQGFRQSRLPVLTPDEVSYIRGTADFLGLNHYTTLMVNDSSSFPLDTVSWESDARVLPWYDPNWKNATSTWLKVVPWGLRKILKQIKSAYGDVPIYITENGYSDGGELKDYHRANYYLTYLSACLEAIHEDGVNLVGYTAWSLMDNFEWMDGYTSRFGIHHVDFKDPNRPRTRKLSGEIYASVLKDRKLPETTLEVPDSAPISTKPISLFGLVFLAFSISYFLVNSHYN